jgi:histidine phosphotransfer protein HptB
MVRMDRGREDEIRARLAAIAGARPGPSERQLLARLIRSFTAKAPDGMDRIGELLRGGDREALADHAHGLKGSAANLGAGTLARILGEVEDAARDGLLPDPDLTVGRLAAELALVLGVLERLAVELDR